MAQISESSKGGKKSLNPDINLVPFIDLLSVCICFLLMAAVWLQVGSLQVKQAYGTDAAPDQPKDTYELAVSFVGPTSVKFEVMKGRERMTSVDLEADSKEAMVTRLTEVLEAAIAAVTEGSDVPVQEIITAATINPKKDAPYGSMIAVMDVLRKHQIVNLAVTPKAG